MSRMQELVKKINKMKSIEKAAYYAGKLTVVFTDGISPGQILDDVFIEIVDFGGNLSKFIGRYEAPKKGYGDGIWRIAFEIEGIF